MVVNFLTSMGKLQQKGFRPQNLLGKRIKMQFDSAEHMIEMLSYV